MEFKILYNLPEIETREGRLILRKLNELDAEDVFEYTSDPEVSLYAPWNTHRTIEEARALIRSRCESYENGNGAIWGIYNKKDKKIIGSAGFISLDVRNLKGEIGYTFSRNYWNKGYASEVLKELIEFGFKRLKLHRVEGVCSTLNFASIKVMEKSNMKREGTLRGYLLKDNNFLDVHIYSIIVNEYQNS